MHRGHEWRGLLYGRPHRNEGFERPYLNRSKRGWGLLQMIHRRSHGYGHGGFFFLYRWRHRQLRFALDAIIYRRSQGNGGFILLWRRYSWLAGCRPEIWLNSRRAGHGGINLIFLRRRKGYLGFSLLYQRSQGHGGLVLPWIRYSCNGGCRLDV